jgi:hypothetical protein
MADTKHSVCSQDFGAVLGCILAPESGDNCRTNGLARNNNEGRFKYSDNGYLIII